MNHEVFSSAFFEESEKIARGMVGAKAARLAQAAKEKAGAVAGKVKEKIPPRILEFIKKHKVPLAAGATGFALRDLLGGSREKEGGASCPGGKIRSKGKGKGLGRGKGKGPIGNPGVMKW